MFDFEIRIDIERINRNITFGDLVFPDEFFHLGIKPGYMKIIGLSLWKDGDYVEIEEALEILTSLSLNDFLKVLEIATEQLELVELFDGGKNDD